MTTRMRKLRKEINQLLGWIMDNPQPKATIDERYKAFKRLIKMRNELKVLTQQANN